MDKNEMLPCPFCGSKGSKNKNPGERWVYFCPKGHTAYLNFTEWNNRTHHAEIEAMARDSARINAIASWCAKKRRIEFAKSILGNGVEIGLHNPIKAIVADDVRSAIDAAMAGHSSEVRDAT